MSLPTVLNEGDTGHISWHEIIHELANEVLTPEVYAIARYFKGPFGDRPTPGRAGSVFHPTTSGGSDIVTDSLELDNGSAFVKFWNLMQDAEWDFRASGNAAKIIVPACEAGLSADQSISQDTEETIAFNTEVRDNASMYAGGSTIVIPRAGIYEVGFEVPWDNDCDQDGATALRARIMQNNSNTVCIDTRTPVSLCHQSASKPVLLAASDDLRLKVARIGATTGATFVLDTCRMWAQLVSDV